ncbi:MAG: hypothetical protein ACNA74_06355 [Desulfurivibrio sp.]
MRKYFYPALCAGLIILLLASLSACSSRTQQVRHLAFDLGILAPESSEQDVLAVLGLPDIRRPAAGGGEEWLYLETHRRLLGRADFHLARITVRDGRLVEAVYRVLTGQEFKEYSEQPQAKP